MRFFTEKPKNNNYKVAERSENIKSMTVVYLPFSIFCFSCSYLQLISGLHFYGYSYPCKIIKITL